MAKVVVVLLSILLYVAAHSTMVCLDVDEANAANPNPILRCKYHARRFDGYNHFRDGAGGGESFAWVASEGPSWSGEYSADPRNGCYLKGNGDSTPGQNGCVDWTVNYNCAGCKLAELQQGAQFRPMHYARTHASGDSMVSLYLSRIVEGTPEYSNPNIDKTTPICTYPFRSSCESVNLATTPCFPTTPCTIPQDIAPGNYTLVWRWLWKFTSPSDRADYCAAADLKIFAASTPIPSSTPVPSSNPPAPTKDADASPVNVFVTVTLDKAPSIVSTQDFALEIIGILNLPKGAVTEVSIDLDQSTSTSTYVRFVLTNALRPDGTRVDPVASAYKLRDLVTSKDASLKSTFYLSGMQINSVLEPEDVKSGDIGSNTTLIIIVCVVGGVVIIAAVSVAIIVTQRRRKGGAFF